MKLHPIDVTTVPEAVRDLALRIEARGGRALVVGGWVRDRLRNEEPADLDVEVVGLDESALDAALGEIGSVHVVGRTFAIRRVRGLDVDVSWGGAAQDAPDTEAAFATAARRRDLTLNAMAFDPLTGALLDPFGGCGDLEARRLRATDRTRFGDDPVRALRTAGLAARLEMQPDAELLAVCAEQDLTRVAGERLMLEWRRLLERAPRPSRALELLERMDQLRAFPELDALRGVPQDARWHPEGDVFVHTAMSLDAAVPLRAASDDATALMFGALCHDFGKATATQVEADRVRALGHERAGLAPARGFLERLAAPNRLMAQVEILVDRHLAPTQLVGQGSGDKAYRRLVRKLGNAGVSARLLADVARADHLGRTTEDAKAGRFDAGDRFMERVTALQLVEGPAPSVVQGRHLIERGYSPGPEFGRILERCTALQDETGIANAEALLERALRH